METIKTDVLSVLAIFDMESLSVDALTLLLFFAAAATLVLALAGMWSDRGNRKTEGRLKQKTQGKQTRASLSYRDDGEGSLLRRLARPLAERLAPSEDEKRTRLQLRMAQAGFMSPAAVLNYYALRIVLAVVLPLAFAPLIPLAATHSSPGTLVVITITLAILGFMLPTLWLHVRISQRIQRLREAFPDSLDLLLVCVESGQSLDDAISRLARELRPTCPELAEQYHLTSLELRAGRPRQQALANMARRTGVDEIASFTTLLIQSDQLGTSIGETLRVYAEDMRITRMLRAEEKAQALPVKIAVPLAMFLLPGFVTIIMIPTAIRIIRALGGTG